MWYHVYNERRLLNYLRLFVRATRQKQTEAADDTGENMSEFFNKMMYGDGGKKDFSPNDLPRTRAQVYKRLLRTQWGKMLITNWWTLLFCVPILAWTLLCLSYGGRFDVTSVEGKQAYMRFLLTMRYPLSILFGGVAFVGFSGTVYTVRNLCWGMPVATTRTFFRGVKSSWLPFVATGLVASLLCCLFDFALTMLSFSAFDTLQKVLLYAVVTFAAVLLCCGIVFMLNLCSTYKMSPFTAVKNSFLLAIKYFLKTFGVLLITVLPLAVLCIIGSVWMYLVVYLVLAAFGFVHIATVWHLFTNSVFDNHINRQNYPDFYRKGLAPTDFVKSTENTTNVDEERTSKVK